MDSWQRKNGEGRFSPYSFATDVVVDVVALHVSGRAEEKRRENVVSVYLRRLIEVKNSAQATVSLA